MRPAPMPPAPGHPANTTREQCRDEGYLIPERVVSRDDLERLRAEGERFVAEMDRASTADAVRLFHARSVIKRPKRRMKLSRRRDSGYVGVPDTPQVTVWCTLDDASVENGTVSILP
ncbi:MAG: hypothetical protein ACOC6J_10750 [Spirochaetota bacterium]